MEFKPSWPLFAFFGTIAFLFFYNNVLWVGSVVCAIALLFYPNPVGHSYIMQQVAKIKNLLKSLIYLVLVLLLIGGLMWLIGKVFSGLGSIGKYEGQTAEEWYNEYDWLYACIEEHPRTAGENCL